MERILHSLSNVTSSLHIHRMYLMMMRMHLLCKANFMDIVLHAAS